MGILSWLRHKTPTEFALVDIVFVKPPEFYVNVEPCEDEQHEIVETAHDRTASADSTCIRFDLEPMFLVIDYRDGAGNFSRRRITTRWIEKRGSVTYVGATCHERRSHRTFRLDRIEGVIDDDGVVEEAAPFFAELLGDDAGYEVSRSAKKTQRVVSSATASPYTVLRREIKPAIVVLSAAARVDGLLHPEEVDRIMIFTETEAECLAKEGFIEQCPGLESFDKLGRLVKRMRPTRSELDEALEQISAWPSDRMHRLMDSIGRVVEADGIVVDSEFDFAREITEWMKERAVPRV